MLGAFSGFVRKKVFVLLLTITFLLTTAPFPPVSLLPFMHGNRKTYKVFLVKIKVSKIQTIILKINLFNKRKTTIFKT